MDFCDIRRRNGENVVEVGGETVSPGREIDRCVLAGDLDHAVGLVTCERGGQTMNRSMDRRSLHPIPSPAHQESEEDCRADPGDCDGT